jgi:hypothetical protein
MINGIPALVGNRGSLPHVVGGDFSAGGGGYVLPIPEWMTPEGRRLPEASDIEPWYDAVCRLWDDPAHYQAVAARARAIAEARYSEAVSRKAHVGFFTALKPGGRPMAADQNRHTRG